MGRDASVSRMQEQLQSWVESHDGRAVFLDCYWRMTEAMNVSIDHGRFEDSTWVADLLDRFAIYYFNSIDGGADGVAVPSPWVLAHAAAVGHDAGTLQLLLAGVNAHINYDLVLTLVDLLDDEWPDADAGRRELRRRDFEQVNVVIEETADMVQDLVVEARSPMLDLLDRGFGRWDERLAVKLLSGWRRRVWRQAVELVEIADADVRSLRVGAIERQCERRAQWILV